jgi:hypothetical protein
MRFLIICLVTVLALISGCATTTGGYAVGPRGESENKNSVIPKEITSRQLSILVPIFDPNIPKNPDNYKRKSVWPELRRAEANRFSVQLRDALVETKAFGAVRVSPDDTATAHLYVHGKILQSNGEDIHLLVSVTDIAGKRLLKKTYRHRVSEYAFNDPRKKGMDVYEPIFSKVAMDVVKLTKKLKTKYITQLNGIEEMRFAEGFSPDYFSDYISTRNKTTKLIGFPADNDPMLQRVRSLRVRDQMFIDNIQVDYNDFRQAMNADYNTWQKQAFYEAKAAREAKAAANAQMLVGILAVAAGASAASNSNSSGGYNSGVALATAGVASIASSVQKSKDSKAHLESLSEIGRSLNIQLAPKVIEMEDRTIELTGTASEQYTSWRAYLREIYLSEQTPEIVL